MLTSPKVFAHIHARIRFELVHFPSHFPHQFYRVRTSYHPFSSFSRGFISQKYQFQSLVKIESFSIEHLVMLPTTPTMTTQRMLLPYLGVWGFNDNVNILLIVALVLAFVVTFITTQLFSMKMKHIEERLLELEARRKDKKKKSKGAVPRAKMV